MAYVQKTRKELLENINAQAQAAGRQSQTGTEIINNQKQLEKNKHQQNLEMNSYVNQFRGQMGLANRATVKAQAQGSTGGSALFNQQQATNALGQDLAQTQQNYQQFTKDVTTQEKQYDETLTSLGEQAQGAVTEQNLATEMESNQTEANNSAKTAANVALGVNVGTTAVALGLQFIPGIGQIAGGLIKGVGALISGGINGWASAEAAKAGGADVGGQVQAGFLSGGVNAATSLFGMGGTGNAAGKAISTTTGIISKEVGENVASRVGKEIVLETGEKLAKKAVIKTPTELLTNDILRDEGIQKSVSTISKRVGIDNVAYGQKINSVMSEKALAIQERAASTAISNGLIPNTPAFDKYISQALATGKNGLQAESMKMLKADFEQVTKKTMTGIKDKLYGAAGKGKVKFSRLDRLRSGEIGKIKYATNTTLRAGTAAAGSYFGTQMVTTGATKKDTNQRTKEKYGSIFDEIGRPDLRAKYGF